MEGNIVLGLGDNIDYEIKWDSKIIEDLIIKHNILDKDIIYIDEFFSERDLVISILNFLKSGEGGECFVSSPEILNDFAKNFKYEITLGGTPVRAAIAMDKIGFKSYVHLVTINDDVKRLLPKDCEYVCSSDSYSSYPHIIIQFNKGTQIDINDINIKSKFSNRIIYVNDYDNAVMKLNYELGDFLENAKVFLISGFNAMKSEKLLVECLENLLNIMKRLNKDAKIFYEDSCFHDRELIKIVHKYLIKHIDIYSLNEDEVQCYLNRKINLLNVEEICIALEDLKNIINVPIIVIHTKYWALAFGENSQLYKDALDFGINMAGTRFRCGDNFNLYDYEETKTFPKQEEAILFSAKINNLLSSKVCCLPSVKIEEVNVTTIGLGDSFVGGFIPFV